jgi:hypothetical protein
MIHSQPSLNTRSYSLLSEARWTVILSIAIATADNFADPDLWVHILTGQTILRTGHIPRLDTYSYSAAGLPWHNHEWLSQVALAFFYAHLGVFGLKLLKILCSTVLMLALAIGISASGASGSMQRMTLILSAVGLATQMQFRPQLFSFMLLSIVMMVLAIEVYRGGVTLWPLIPMFALWANFHGGYIVGLGAMGVAAAVMFVRGFGSAAGKASAIRLGLVTLGCAAATILNPFGVALWTGVATSVRDPLIRQTVNDWVPLPTMMLHVWRESKPQTLQYATPLLMFAGLIAALAMAPDLDDAPLIAVAAIFIGAAFWATRNVALAVIAVTIPLARHASLAMEAPPAIRVGDRLGNAAGAQASGGHGPPAALLAICAAVLALVGGTFSNRLETWKPVPADAVAFMQQHDLHGNVLCQFEWGSYLMWHMGDRVKLFVDTRAELVYPESVRRQYAIFFYGMEGADSLLDAYPHDFVLIGTQTKACQVVMQDPRWHLIYRDATAALFARAPLPGVPPVAGSVAASAAAPANTYFP